MTSNNYDFIISVTFKKQLVPSQFSRTDWMKMIDETRPIGFASPEHDVREKSVLFASLQKISKAMRIDLEDAAHWVLRKVLDDRFADARRMRVGEIPWDDDVLYICRVMALQVCRHLGPKDKRYLAKIDQMINSLLMTEEELLQEAMSGDGALH
jgi:hypothetical protein